MPGLRVRVGAWYPTTTALARAATCAGFPGTASAAGLSPATLAGPPASATPAASALAPSVRPASHLRTRIVISSPPPLLLSAPITRRLDNCDHCRRFAGLQTDNWPQRNTPPGGQFVTWSAPRLHGLAAVDVDA